MWACVGGGNLCTGLGVGATWVAGGAWVRRCCKIALLPCEQPQFARAAVQSVGSRLCVHVQLVLASLTPVCAPQSVYCSLFFELLRICLPNQTKSGLIQGCCTSACFCVACETRVVLLSLLLPSERCSTHFSAAQQCHIDGWCVLLIQFEHASGVGEL